MPNINVPIRIEPTDEYKIQEISYDGQEKSILPLSMSEHLSQLISRIDFNQPIDELKEELEEAEKRGDEDEDAEQIIKPGPPIQPGSTWPFESMRTKLRTALTEICVLNDVLAIAKEKKYMVFDTVQQKQADPRPIIALMAKKRTFSSAANILADGASTLRGMSSSTNSLGFSLAGSDTPSQGSSQTSSQGQTKEPNFYEELHEMRQHWRLKRHGNNIIGDLGDFRPIGHRFTGNSMFRVIKTDPSTRGSKNQALAVQVSPDLEGRAYIQASIIRDDDTVFCDLSTTANGRCYEAARESTWQEKLDSAQNILFCNELFSHLANQAVQYQFVIPTTVTGNQIILALFPDIKLYITLVHLTPNTKTTRELTQGMKKLQKEHKRIFELSLHKMFHTFYTNFQRRLQGRDIPKEAGPNAIDYQTLYEMTRQESSLDMIVQQAQHLIMRQQTMNVIDTFAAQIKDPLIISHWFCLNSPTTSIVRVDIVSHNNDILGRSHMLIYIGTRTLRVITRDCKNLQLGYEADELKHLLVWQSCLHQFIASDKLSKLLGWYTLILNYNVNVTRQEQSSTAFSLVICSSNCSHLISIKSGPQFGLAVEVAQFKDAHSSMSAVNSLGLNGFNPNTVTNSANSNGVARTNGSKVDDRLSRFHDLVENFREVDWDMTQGRDFLTRLELLMAAYADIN